MKKRLCFLLIVQVALLLSFTLHATSIWDGTASIWTYGSGTEADPYQIATAQNLAYLAQSVNAGESYAGKYFCMTDDIDLNNINWNPVGDSLLPFAALFNAQNHILSNVQSDGGVFKNLSGELSNLSVYGSVSKSSGIVDILGGKIFGCKNYRNLNSDKNCGGICNYSTGEIVNCINYGTVNVLFNQKLACARLTITKVAGGIVCSGSGVVRGCSNYGAITVTTQYSNVNSSIVNCYAYAGGVSGNAAVSIEDSHNYANVTALAYHILRNTYVGLHATAHAGGVSGVEEVSITNCSNAGTISAEATGSVIKEFLFGDCTPTTSCPEKTYKCVVECDSLRGSVTGSGNYPPSSSVSISASAASGFVFSCWNDGVKTNPRTIVLSTDTVFRALFVPMRNPEFIYAYYSDGTASAHLCQYADSVGYLVGDDVFKLYQTGFAYDSIPMANLDSLKCFQSVTDICGNVYPIVKIGNQIWMAENYRCASYDTGSEAYKNGLRTIPRVLYSASYAPFYQDAAATANWSSSEYASSLTTDEISKLGLLYNYAAAIGVNDASGTVTITGKRQGICPNGWHIPSTDERSSLLAYISAKLKSSNGIGTALKSKHGWYNTGSGVDCVGFGALPAGMSYRTTVVEVGTNAYFILLDNNNGSCETFGVSANMGQLSGGTIANNLGASVRCVKD